VVRGDEGLALWWGWPLFFGGGRALNHPLEGI